MCRSKLVDLNFGPIIYRDENVVSISIILDQNHRKLDIHVPLRCIASKFLKKKTTIGKEIARIRAHWFHPVTECCLFFIKMPHCHGNVVSFVRTGNRPQVTSIVFWVRSPPFVGMPMRLIHWCIGKDILLSHQSHWFRDLHHPSKAWKCQKQNCRWQWSGIYLASNVTSITESQKKKKSDPRQNLIGSAQILRTCFFGL